MSASSNGYRRAEIVDALAEFYSFLITLPHIPPNALVFPSAQGWSGVNTKELRVRGKTDEVIELLWHIPYLRAEDVGMK